MVSSCARNVPITPALQVQMPSMKLQRIKVNTVKCPAPFQFILPLFIPMEGIHDDSKDNCCYDKRDGHPGDPFSWSQVQLSLPLSKARITGGDDDDLRVWNDTFHTDIMDPFTRSRRRPTRHGRIGKRCTLLDNKSKLCSSLTRICRVLLGFSR